MHTTLQIGAVAYALAVGGPRAARAAVARHLAFCYGDYPPARGFVDHAIRLGPPNLWRRHVRPSLVSDVPAPVPLVPLPARLAPVALESAMNLATAGENERFVLFHAATIARGSRALVLPGDSGAGKSTLAAAAMLAGWTLLSDEYAAFDPEAGCGLAAVPRAVSLKNESISYLAGRFAAAHRLGERWAGTPKGTIAFLRAAPVPADRRFRPAGVVFPDRRPGQGLRLTRLDPVEAATRLLETAMNFATQGEPAAAVLRDLAAGLPAFLLTYDDAAAALPVLDDLLAGRAKGARR